MAGWTKDDIKRCLGTIPPFSDLTESELVELASASRDWTFRKGARIFEEGAPADYCYVITNGRARVILSGEGGVDVLLQVITAPALVGEVALLDRSTRSASLVAADSCHVIRVPGAAFERLRRNPAFEQRLVAGLAATLRKADDHLRVISTLPARNRVIWCLARLAHDSGTRTGSVITIPNPSNTELAELAGCTRETVNRALGLLKRRKLVTWDRHTMRIDADGLQRHLPAG